MVTRHRMKRTPYVCKHQSYTFYADTGTYVCDGCGATLSPSFVKHDQIMWLINPFEAFQDPMAAGS
jgi:methionyl-tRNA synthetase